MLCVSVNVGGDDAGTGDDDDDGGKIVISIVNICLFGYRQ